MIGDVLTEANQRFRQDLSIDDLVGEYGFRVNIGRILPFLYVNGPTLQGNGFDLAELLAAQLAQVFIAAQFRILRRKAVSMNGRPSVPADRSDEGEPRKSGSLVE